MNTNLLDMRLDVRTGLSIATIAILILSALIIALPVAGAAGTITLSSSTIRGNKVVQVTVTDTDLDGSDASPPRVTLDYTIHMSYGNQSLTQLPMYQMSGGSWVGFVAVANDTHTRNIPSSPSAQDPIPPGGTTGSFDTTHASLTEGSEPQMGTSGTLFRGSDIVAKIQGLAEGSVVTLTYNDADGDKSVELTYTSGNEGTTAVEKTTYPPGQRVYVSMTDSDLNLDPTAKDSIAVGSSANQYNGTFTGSSTFRPGGGTSFVTANETGPNTNIFKGYAVLSSTTTNIGDVLTVTYVDAAPSGNRRGSCSIAATTGTIGLDASNYKYSSTATVTLTEPDLNVNSDSTDTISADTGVLEGGKAGRHASYGLTDYQLGNVYVYSDFTNGTRHSSGSGVYMEETGKNTGVFTGKVYFTSTNTTQANKPTLVVNSSDTILVLYRDDVNSVGGNTNVTASATFKTYTGTIALDKAKYSAQSLGTLTVTDPDRNTQSSVIDQITRDSDATTKTAGYAYLYTTQDSTGSGILLVETGVNTDIFTGTFTFSATATSSTQANTPTLAVRAGNTITAVYKDAVNANGGTTDVTTTASYSTNTGTLSLNAASYTPDVNSAGQGAYVEVTVVDPDRNTITASIDEFTATSTQGVYYRVGTTQDTGVTMTETGANTDTFTGHFNLPAAVAKGDILTVKYIDPDNAAGISANITQFASITTHTGIVTPSTTTYAQSATDGWVRVEDTDRNIDPTVVDTIPAGTVNTAGVFDMRSTSDPTGISIALTETGVNTGIFEGNFTLTTGSSSGTSLKALKGATITFRYKDLQDSAGAIVAVEKTAMVSATTGTVTLDKTQYPVFGRVTVTVNDPDENDSTSAADSITNTLITVRTTTMTSSDSPVNSLTETGANTGIFTTDFTLNAAGASGSSIVASDGDGLTVVYTEAYDASGAQDVTHSASATIKATTATLTFDKANYELTDSAIVTLTDPDKNTNADLKESYSVSVYSATDAGGLSLSVTETGANTGIFEATITFSTAKTAGTQLKVTSGDTVTASITDYTVAGYKPSTPTAVSQAVTGTATVGVPSELEMTGETTGATTKDSTGAEKTTFAAGETVLPSATVKNTAATSQAYLIAIQMIAPDGTVYPTNYIQTTLIGGQEFTFSPSFVLPSDAQTGTWSFEVNVFSNFPAQGGVAKAEPVTQTFTVE